MSANPIVLTPTLSIGERKIGLLHPTYFIADIAANHNGSLAKAKDLIARAKEAGADAAKFQHFKAETIVSQKEFDALPRQLSHQSKWKKSVFQIYKDASVPLGWTRDLKNYCDKIGIDFFTSPYDLEIIDQIDPFVPAYKIGSGDITWIEAIQKIARKNKPIFLATGASTMREVEVAVQAIEQINQKLCLMQCNTNYTAQRENFKHIHLNVLKTFAKCFPELVLGLSDHTPGHATVLGAVALGARAIEKHFTDNRSQEGPDHAFSMDPSDWRAMVERTRELEIALGSEDKHVAGNEQETVFIQRRCLRAAHDLPEGTVLTRMDVEMLRPVTPGAVTPAQLQQVIGRTLKTAVAKGDALLESSLL